ncbi:MAG: DPP IV N-terminal domain-containing protein, partial [Candidatus Cryptobacteroides sp.]
MKKFIIILGALCSGLSLSVSLSAQEPLVRKANSPEGKLMTMEEAVWLRNLTPPMERFRFDETEAGFPLAFTKDNNLYVRRDSTSAIDTITRLSDRNFVAGQTVSRNEFGIDGGIFWSPDKNLLAYYIKDESRVTDFPLFDITTRTG